MSFWGKTAMYFGHYKCIVTLIQHWIHNWNKFLADSSFKCLFNHLCFS